MLENPIATSLKIPTSGGFGVLRQQPEIKTQRARVTNQWMIGKDQFDLTSKIEFATPANNRTIIVMDFAPGYRVNRVTSRGVAIPFLQWNTNQRDYLQIFIDRDSGDITELMLYADSAKSHPLSFSEPIPFWRSNAISMSEQTTEVFANPVWSIQLQSANASAEVAPISVQGKDRAKSLLNIPVPSESTNTDIALRLLGNKITQRWQGILVVRPVQDDTGKMDWELLAIGNEPQKVRPSISVAAPTELATRWSSPEKIVEIPDLNLDRGILLLSPKLLSNNSDSVTKEFIGASTTESASVDPEEKTKLSIDPDLNDPNLDRTSTPSRNSAPYLGIAFRIRFESESGVSIAPSDTYRIESLANPDVKTWFAVEASMANQIDLSLYEVLDTLSFNLGASIPELEGATLVRPRTKSSDSEFRANRIPGTMDQPIRNQTLATSTNSNTNIQWKLASHKLIGPHAIEPDRLVCVSQFWCSGIVQNSSSPLRWTHSIGTRGEWVRINGQSVSFQQAENQITVPFESVGFPLHVELWTSFPCQTQKPIPISKLLPSVPTPSDSTIQITYWHSLGDPEPGWVQKESSSMDSEFALQQSLSSVDSTTTWVQDHAITSLQLLREAIADSDDVDEGLLLAGDRGDWIAELALECAYWLGKWATVRDDSKSVAYSQSVSEWTELQTRHPALLEFVLGRQSLSQVSPSESVAQLATDGTFASEPTAATSTKQGTSGIGADMLSGIGPIWLRAIATLIMILAMVMSAWFWDINKTKLLQSPWWLLTATSGFTWLLTGSLFPATLMMSIALLLAIDSYWIVSERFRQTAIRGQR
ncbi:MAG: hypothetical protein FJ308_04775 [Planctomycetes bacterium]|nr:hypothetical protein [Planctomycetota bacterium]